MNIEMITKNLELSVELEEYEAAKIFKEHLDKLKNK
jgi:protein-arginine kinase activator protein McsA